MKKYYEGHGSRKRCRARVRVYLEKGTSTINDRPVDEFFPDELSRQRLMRPLVVSGMGDEAHFSAKVTGGGTTGILDSVILGISRAIVKVDEKYRAALRKEDLLSRDPRKVERKKVFFRKSRKKPQYSKR